MTSPSKKVKKLGDGDCMDYKYLLPSDLDEKTQSVLERFLKDEPVTAEEKEEAFDMFGKAFLAGVNCESSSTDHKASEVQFNTNDYQSPALTEERQRINVGWMASSSDAPPCTDRAIADYSQNLGCQMYNFVSYPIGGVRRGFWNKNNTEVSKHVANMDQVYVVFLRQFCSLNAAKEIFTFDHPNFSRSSNDRHTSVTFEMDRAADIMGFAGYFHMTLYKDVTLSIEPFTYSKGMISWFPALIPLRQLHRVHSGDQISFVIDRKSDECGVWYEWLLEHKTADGTTTKTSLQNENGDNYYMRLNCDQ